MTVFGCRTCGTTLTVPVAPVALPVHARQKYSNGPGSLAPAPDPGTFAVDPLPSGPPWRRWADLAPGEAGALGWYAPQFSVSTGPTGRVLIAPGDIRNTVLEPALAGDTACCGLDGDEPNMTCTTCRTPVATRIDDCGLRQQTWLDPRTTRVVDDGPGPHPRLDWSQLIDHRPGVPPSEPGGSWNPLWAAATAAALAHALAASGGEPVTILDPQVAGFFQPVLDRLTGTGPAGTRTTSRPYGRPALQAVRDQPAVPGQEGPRREGPSWERSGRERPGRERPRLEKPGWERPGQERSGQERPGQERPGQERPGREWPGWEGHTMVLAGPGLPARDGGDLALLPLHPQTGEPWPVAPPSKPVPLAWEVWRHLAFHRTPKPVGRSAPIPPEAPSALLPGYRFDPDARIFLRVLARRPEVRQPRLRAVYDRVHRSHTL